MLKIHSRTSQGDERLGLLSWPREEAEALMAEMAAANPTMTFQLVPAESVSPDVPTPYGMIQPEFDFGGETGGP